MPESSSASSGSAPAHRDRDMRDQISAGVRVLAIAETLGVLLLLVGDLLAGNIAQLQLSAALAVPALAFVAVMDRLRHTRFAPALVYANLTLGALLLAVADPLSGIQTGDTWVLFQLMPPIATLILRRPRATLTMVAITLAVLVGSALLQLSGVVAVRLAMPADLLLRHLAYEVLVLMMISAATHWIGVREQRALDSALAAREQLDRELHTAQIMADEKARLSEALAARLAEIQQRDAQISRQEQQERQLRQTIRALANPVLPVANGVVIAPLIGDMGETRAADFQRALLAGVEQNAARAVVIDITGVPLIDSSVARALLDAAAAVRLLGVTPILVGIRPEVAQTIVGLGVNLRELPTRADLRSGVAYALRVIGA